MNTLIKPQAKLKITRFDTSTYQIEEKVINQKNGLNFKLYQKFIVILLTSFMFLIFPESPQDHDNLCKKHNSLEACIVW